jgi:hypothetical protein
LEDGSMTEGEAAVGAVKETTVFLSHFAHGAIVRGNVARRRAKAAVETNAGRDRHPV